MLYIYAIYMLHVHRIIVMLHSTGLLSVLRREHDTTYTTADTDADAATINAGIDTTGIDTTGIDTTVNTRGASGASSVYGAKDANDAKHRKESPTRLSHWKTKQLTLLASHHPIAIGRDRGRGGGNRATSEADTATTAAAAATAATAATAGAGGGGGGGGGSGDGGGGDKIVSIGCLQTVARSGSGVDSRGGGSGIESSEFVDVIAFSVSGEVTIARVYNRSASESESSNGIISIERNIYENPPNLGSCMSSVVCCAAPTAAHTHTHTAATGTGTASEAALCAVYAR
jgi:hypothetical protein